MILLDANLLLYAYNTSFPQHERARSWLEGVLSRPEPVGMSWTTILAFLRIATNPRAFEAPLSPEEATACVDAWLRCPQVVILGPTDRHWEILARLLRSTRSRGPAVMDAHLAALAVEHGAVLCTTDRDFARFPGLRVCDPLAAGEAGAC